MFFLHAALFSEKKKWGAINFFIMEKDKCPYFYKNHPRLSAIEKVLRIIIF